jgi:hypothetical protein
MFTITPGIMLNLVYSPCVDHHRRKCFACTSVNEYVFRTVDVLGAVGIICPCRGLLVHVVGVIVSGVTLPTIKRC